MPFEMPIEKWAGTVNTVTIGAMAAEGGTRTSVVTVGGDTGLPFLHFEGNTPHRPAIAMDVFDIPPSDLPASVALAIGDACSDPATWARKCVEEFDADLICLRLLGARSDRGDRSPD
jgi:acetyl-CoA decarbonylase/synthase, CODH/ACS complex subunit delta